MFEPCIKLIKGTHEIQKKQRIFFEDHAMAKDCWNENTLDEINVYKKFVGRIFTSMAICMIVLDIFLVIIEDMVTTDALVLILILGFLVLVGHLLAISKFTQIKPRGFQTPCVPLVPAMGIFINVYLMLRLSYLTIIRFAVWMVLGFVTYFKYGIWESSLHQTTSTSSP